MEETLKNQKFEKVDNNIFSKSNKNKNIKKRNKK